MLRKIKERIKATLNNAVYNAVERYCKIHGLDSFRENVISELARIRNNAQDVTVNNSAQEYQNKVMGLALNQIRGIRQATRDISMALYGERKVPDDAHGGQEMYDSEWVGKKALVGQAISEKDLDILLAPKQLEDSDMARIEEIRQKSISFTKESWTSLLYQNEIVDALTRAASIQGGSILEVGILRGGLSCQLAYFAHKYKRNLYLVDTEVEMIEASKKHLEDQDLLRPNIHFTHGNITDFFRQHSFLRIPPCFVVVDALHSYNAVRHDACTVLANIPNTPVIAFHDYGLRSPTVRQIANDYPWDLNLDAVDIAIHDVIGNCTDALHPIGFKDGKGDIDKTNITGYAEKGSCEGVLMFPELLDVSAFTAAYAYCAYDATR